MSQNDQVLKVLMTGMRVTAKYAYDELHIMRLAARISDLKAKGNTIYTRTIKDGKKSYAEYWMDVERISLFDDHLIIERARYGGLQ